MAKKKNKEFGAQDYLNNVISDPTATMNDFLKEFSLVKDNTSEVDEDDAMTGLLLGMIYKKIMHESFEEAVICASTTGIIIKECQDIDNFSKIDHVQLRGFAKFGYDWGVKHFSDDNADESEFLLQLMAKCKYEFSGKRELGDKRYYRAALQAYVYASNFADDPGSRMAILFKVISIFTGDDIQTMQEEINKIIEEMKEEKEE